jgi:hypothetical protein
MTHRIWVGRPVWSYVAALCLAGSASIASCYNGDQSCGEAYNPNDLGDHCPYGPPGGPKPGAFEPDCPRLEPLTGTACDTVTWAAVHARMVDPTSGNCADPTQGCHTNPLVGLGSFVDPANPANDSKAFLNAMAGFTGKFGVDYPTVDGTDLVPRLYYDRAAPHLSWWPCNLRGDAGNLMPKYQARMAPADIDLLETWLACGAPGDPGP